MTPASGRALGRVNPSAVRFFTSGRSRTSRRRRSEQSGSLRRLADMARRRGAVEVAGAFFEGADHAAHRLAEEDLDHLLHQPRLEFEIDKEIDPAAARHSFEDP